MGGQQRRQDITILDTQRGEKVGMLTGFGSPYRIGISRTGRVAVVSDPVGNKLWLFEVGTNRELARIDLFKEKSIVLRDGGPPGIDGAGPEGVTFDPIADVAYVTLHATNQVAGVDLEQYKVIGVGAVGAGPDGIAYSPLVRR